MENIKSNELNMFKEEWEQLSKKYSLLLGKNKHFYATYYSDEKYVLKIANNSKHISTDDFRIVFDDGKTIPSNNVSMKGNRILAELIKYVGVEKVYKLNIEATGRRPLITNNVDKISHLEPLSLGNGWYVITKTPNSEKIKQINRIIKELEIKAKIEIIKHS